MRATKLRVLLVVVFGGCGPETPAGPLITFELAPGANSGVTSAICADTVTDPAAPDAGHKLTDRVYSVSCMTAPDTSASTQLTVARAGGTLTLTSDMSSGTTRRFGGSSPLVASASAYFSIDACAQLQKGEALTVTARLDGVLTATSGGSKQEVRGVTPELRRENELGSSGAQSPPAVTGTWATAVATGAEKQCLTLRTASNATASAALPISPGDVNPAAATNKSTMVFEATISK